MHMNMHCVFSICRGYVRRFLWEPSIALPDYGNWVMHFKEVSNETHGLVVQNLKTCFIKTNTNMIVIVNGFDMLIRERINSWEPFFDMIMYLYWTQVQTCLFCVVSWWKALHHNAGPAELGYMSIQPRQARTKITTVNKKSYCLEIWVMRFNTCLSS